MTQGDMVVYYYDPTTWDVRQGYQFKINYGYIGGQPGLETEEDG